MTEFITYENAIHGARGTTTLGMTKGCDSCIQSQSISQDIFDVLSPYGLQIRIMSSFSYNDDGLALSY